MSSLPSDRNAPFAAWTPELMDQACAEYDARSAEINQYRQEAYAEGRKDEREANDQRIQMVDWLGMALELEAQAKRVESKTAMRAMYSAARGLRLMGGQ